MSALPTRLANRLFICVTLSVSLSLSLPLSRPLYSLALSLPLSLPLSLSLCLSLYLSFSVCVFPKLLHISLAVSGTSAKHVSTFSHAKATSSSARTLVGVAAAEAGVSDGFSRVGASQHISAKRKKRSMVTGLLGFKLRFSSAVTVMVVEAQVSCKTRAIAE